MQRVTVPLARGPPAGGTMQVCLEPKYSTCVANNLKGGWTRQEATTRCDNLKAQGKVISEGVPRKRQFVHSNGRPSRPYVSLIAMADQQKITFGEMREMGVSGVVAAITLRSTPTAGRTMFGCRISRRNLHAPPAESAGRTCARILTEKKVFARRP